MTEAITLTITIQSIVSIILVAAGYLFIRKAKQHKDEYGQKVYSRIGVLFFIGAAIGALSMLFFFV